MVANHTPSEPSDVRVIARALAAPFSETEVKFKPQAVKGNRALALAYVDVRAIMDRLDSVLGFENWQDDYQLLPDNSVLCRLRLRIGKKWVTKMDVGGPSEQPDGGDRLKAAVSDALKRAAVKFGIGRYLYRLPQQWADYDPVKRQFTSPPRLPDWATAPKSAKTASPPAAEKKPGLPASGKELHRRLRDADNDLASKGLCPIGALLSHVTQAGVKAGFGADLNEWAGPAIELAIVETRAFKSRLPLGLETKTVA
jgi:Rad52/22 family double-strand break repair protein